MARMVPDGLGVGHVDRTELEVFEVIRSQTPPEWIGFHHVGLPRHPTKPIAEIDFVVVGPPGIFCLEVKGGAVSRKVGIWFAGTRELKESPFTQVGGAAAALRAETPDIHGFLLGWGCVFPHCRFDVDGPEVLPEVVYDQAAAERGFQAYIERLAEYWKGRYPHARRLGSNDVSKVTHALRGDFSTVESVMPAVRDARAKLVLYTEAQAKAVEGLRHEPQVVVRGAAGTGKTLLGVQEAVRLAKSGRKTLFTCFTKAVSRYIDRSVKRPELTVAHIDSLIERLIGEGDTRDQIPVDVDEEELFQLYRPLAAIEAVERLGDEVRYDAIVVDEGQDLLTQPRLDVLDALLHGGFSEGKWRVFWDPLQALFVPEGDARLDLLLERSGLGPTSYLLRLNCRNTREVASRVEDLSDVAFEEIAVVEGPQVEDVEWSDQTNQARRVGGVLRDWMRRGVAPDSMVVLSPRRFDSSVASTVSNLPARIVDHSGHPPDPGPGTIPFSTIHAFKGLEADAVMLVDIEDIDSPLARSLLYVGASRARVLLGVARSAATAGTLAERIAARASAPGAGGGLVLEL